MVRRYACAWGGHDEYVTLGGAVFCERCMEYLADPNRPGHRPREVTLPAPLRLLRAFLARVP